MKLAFAVASLVLTAAASMAGASAVSAQEDGLVAHPNVYRVQFENDWVRLVRVTMPGNTTLPAHTHPPAT